MEAVALDLGMQRERSCILCPLLVHHPVGKGDQEVESMVSAKQLRVYPLQTRASSWESKEKLSAFVTVHCQDP